MNEVVSLLAYFMVYAFIGWVLESTYKSILQKRIVNRIIGKTTWHL